jgi:hypothetical protein
MDETCSTHGIDERCTQNLYGRNHLRDLDVGGRIILKWILNRV